MTPLYYAISFVLVGWHSVFSTLGLDPGGRRGLGAVDHRPDPGHPGRADPAVREADQVQPEHAADPAQGQGAAEEVRPRPGAARPGDDEALQGRRAPTRSPRACRSCCRCRSSSRCSGCSNNAAHGEPKGVLTEPSRPSSSATPSCSGVPALAARSCSADGDVGVIVLAALLVLAMTATTFLTQRQLMSKNMPADALTGPYAQQQKLLLYVLPVVFAVGGIAFPIGVLLYWTTSNLWTMGQQFYVIRNNPAPGTPAFEGEGGARRGQGRQARRGADAGRRDDGRRVEEPEPTGARASGSSPRSSRASSARSPAEPAQQIRRQPEPQTEPDRTTRPAPRTHDERPTTTQTDDPRPTRRRPTRADERRASDDARPTDAEASRARRATPSRSRAASRTRATSPPTTSRSCSTSPTSTATWTWTSRATGPSVSIVGADLHQLVGRNGEVLDALQELTRLAVYRETGERSRLMLDISGYRAEQARGAGGARRRDGGRR